MSGDAIRELLCAQPWQPFEVHLASVDVYQVRHLEQALVTGATCLEITKTRPKKSPKGKP